MKKEILLGDEAIGLGAIHAGLSGVYGYPGTPSTEIFEFIEKRTKKAGDVHAFWSTNEKVAYEEALGYQKGKRTRATGTWQLVRRHGLLAAVQKRFDSRDGDEVVPVLKELGMEDYSFGAVLERYPDAFGAEAA